MKKKTNIIAIALSLIVLIAVSSLLYKNFQDKYHPQNQITDPGNEEEKWLAPDFVVYDVNGKTVKLSDYFGQPIIVGFWASWCPSCREQLPLIEKLYQENHQKVVFLMINATGSNGETQTSGYQYYNQQGFSFPLYFDLDLSASEAYNAWGLPCTFFIDSSGQPVAYALGAIDELTLNQGLKLIYP